MTRHLARLGIVVPTTSDRAALARCLDRLRPAAAAGARVVVVDDGASRRLGAFLRAAYPFVRARSWASSPLAGQRGRAGLGAWLHLGVEAVGKREYLAVLDPSTHADPSALAELVAALEDDPSAAVALPQLASAFEFGGLDRALACSVIRRADWELVGGTDVALVHDHVGEDLVLRLTRRGRRVLKLPSTVSLDPRLRSLDGSAIDRTRRGDRTRFLARHGTGLTALLARGRLVLENRTRHDA